MDANECRYLVVALGVAIVGVLHCPWRSVARAINLWPVRLVQGRLPIRVPNGWQLPSAMLGRLPWSEMTSCRYEALVVVPSLTERRCAAARIRLPR